MWGCIRSTGESLLEPIKNKVKSEVYISMMKEHFADFLYMQELFQQDKGPANTALKTENFLWEKVLTILINLPAQSQVINIIETSGF